MQDRLNSVYLLLLKLFACPQQFRVKIVDCGLDLGTSGCCHSCQVSLFDLQFKAPSRLSIKSIASSIQLHCPDLCAVLSRSSCVVEGQIP